MATEVNSVLRKAIAVIEPWNDKPGLFAAIRSGKLRTRGLTVSEIVTYLGELDALGLIEAEIGEDDCKVKLTSDALAAVHDHRLGIVKTIGRYTFQFVLGCVGGTVVWALSHCVPG